jgi:hypothetical protein
MWTATETHEWRPSLPLRSGTLPPVSKDEGVLLFPPIPLSYILLYTRESLRIDEKQTTLLGCRTIAPPLPRSLEPLAADDAPPRPRGRLPTAQRPLRRGGGRGISDCHHSEGTSKNRTQIPIFIAPLIGVTIGYYPRWGGSSVRTRRPGTASRGRHCQARQAVQAHPVA